MATKKKSTNRTPNFSAEEDAALTKAWVSVSEQADVGTDQDAQCFWNGIYDKYKAILVEDGAKTEQWLLETRTVSALQCRWRRQINKSCQLFLSIMRRIIQENHSGWNTEDVKNEAARRYRTQEKTDFKFMQCWQIVKGKPKFLPAGKMEEGSADKYDRQDDSNEQSSLLSESTISNKVNGPPVTQRPIGAKKTIDKKKQQINSFEDREEKKKHRVEMSNFMQSFTATQEKMTLIQEQFAKAQQEKIDLAFVAECCRLGQHNDADKFMEVLMEQKLGKHTENTNETIVDEPLEEELSTCASEYTDGSSDFTDCNE